MVPLDSTLNPALPYPFGASKMDLTDPEPIHERAGTNLTAAQLIQERIRAGAAVNRGWVGSEPPPNWSIAMKLAPKVPPGRSIRRARAFAIEIGQLRAQGYTFEAIREALAAAGVAVSKSTVQREVARLASRASSGSVTAAESGIPKPDAAPALLPAPPSRTTSQLSGKEIAEAFVSTLNTNPLFHHRSTE